MAATSIDTGLPAIPDLTNINTETGVSKQFIDIYNAIGILAQGIDAYTGNTPASQESSTSTPESTILVGNTANMFAIAGTNISAGFLVYFTDDGSGNAIAHLADASLGFAANAQGISMSSGNGGTKIQVMLLGLFDFGGSVTAGQTYYCSGSTGAGGISTVKPTASGWAVQPVGFGVDGSSIFINPSLFVTVNP